MLLLPMPNGPHRKIPPAWILGGLILAALAVRLVRIDLPILEVATSRQAQTAVNIRTYYREGIDLLHPRQDDQPGEGIVVHEFPAYQALVATAYRLLGGVHEWAGRLLSILCGTLAAIPLFVAVRRVRGDPEGLLAAAIFLFSPVSIVYSRTVQPDAMMLCASLAGLAFAVRWGADGRLPDLLAAAASFALAGTLKPLGLLPLLPAIFWIRELSGGRRGLDGRTLAAGAGMLLLVALWYAHMRSAAVDFPSAYARDAALDRWFRTEILLSAEFYRDVLDRWSGFAMTPVGFGAMVLGLCLPAGRGGKGLGAWMLGTLGAVAFFNANFKTHDYYYLSVLPVASLFAARGLLAIREAAGGRLPRAGTILAIGIWGLLVARHAAGGYRMPEHLRPLPEVGRIVQAHTAPDTRIVAASGGGPAFLYYCDRKGTSMVVYPPDEVAAVRRELEDLDRPFTDVDPFAWLERGRREGGTVLAVVGMKRLRAHPEFERFCRSSFETIAEDPDRYVLFRMPPLADPD